MPPRSFIRVTGRLCAQTRKTAINSLFGGLSAAAPQLVSQGQEGAGAARITLGANGGELRESLQMQITAQSGTTLMVDSAMPVKLMPAGNEFGIGIHARVESDALLVITPDAHVPHLDAHTGLWTRYDLSPDASLVSVQLADLNNQAARPPTVGGRYTVRTRVHHTTAPHAEEGTQAAMTAAAAASSSFLSAGGSGADPAFRAAAALPNIGESCARASTSSCGLPFGPEAAWSCDWTYGRRFKGLTMGSPTTNVIASVLLAGPRAEEIAAQFRDVQGLPIAHASLGLSADAHLAVQDMHLPGGKLSVARIGTEHREDMHRLLRHCLAPLQAELGVAPYRRMLRASQTAQSMGMLFAAQPFLSDPDEGPTLYMGSPPKLHVQHGDSWRVGEPFDS